MHEWLLKSYTRELLCMPRFLLEQCEGVDFLKLRVMVKKKKASVRSLSPAIKQQC